MEKVQFVFWELTKSLVLIFLGLVSVKAVGALKPIDGSRAASWLVPLKGAFYALILGLAVCGADIVGNDLSAETYYWVSATNLNHRQLDKAYSNALRSVNLRPGILRYWQRLAEIMLRARQYTSAIQDELSIKALNGGQLPEDDAVRFATSSLLLGRYHRVITLTAHLIRTNPSYAVPFILRGNAELSLRAYGDAEKTFLGSLKRDPTLTPAVEGLAQAYYLSGDHSRCMAVLNATTKFPFTPEERKRFQELRELYGQ